MADWRRLLIKEFGKKATKKWKEAAIDIILVDKGIKQSLLFDHWGSSPTEMKNFLVSAQRDRMVNAKIVIVSIGLDVLLVNKKILSIDKYGSESSDLIKTLHFVDVSYSLKEPKVIDLKDPRVSSTVNDFFTLMECINKRHDLDVINVEDIVDIDLLNVPCLFGLFLGYPSVYWYDQSVSEENCLNGISLRVFQVFGIVDDKNQEDPFRRLHSDTEGTNSGANIKKDIILSFSIPDALKSSLLCQIHSWFSLWKTSQVWSSLYKDVIIHEDIKQPEAVTL